MRMKTLWHGVEMLAENDADKQILKGLVKSLPDGAEDCYEDGDIDILEVDTGQAEQQGVMLINGTVERYNDEFSVEEIKNSPMVIYISR